MADNRQPNDTGATPPTTQSGEALSAAEQALATARPAVLPGDTGAAGTEATAYVPTPRAPVLPNGGETQMLPSSGPATGAGADATAMLPSTGPAPSSEATACLPVDGSATNVASNDATEVMSTIPFAQKGDDSWDEFVGRELAGYVIKRKLAEGGMGVVYLGEHAKIGRKSAIKVLKLEFCSNAEVVERFHQEARAVNEIKHDNIVDIYDFGTDSEGRAFFVMELLEGESLGDRLKRGPLSFEDSLPILRQSLRALSAAHQKGFTHRDLKPDNIWLRQKDGGKLTVKLLDFGIAKLLGTGNLQAKVTKTGTMMGTPDYMSPEQINGDANIDQRADLYSIGCIIYELFTQTTPFASESMAGVMSGHLFREPPKILDSAVPELGVPAAIDVMVERLMAKEANDRYATANDVLTDLASIADNAAPTLADALKKRATLSGASKSKTVVPASATQPGSSSAVAAETMAPAAEPSKPRSRVGMFAALAAAAALGGGGAYLLKSQRNKPSEPVVQTPTPAVLQPTPVAPPEAPRILDPASLRKDSLALVRSGLLATEAPHRAFAAQAIGEALDTESADALTKLTQSDADEEVRGWSAQALGSLGATSAKSTMTAAEAEASPPLKVWYAAALAKLGDNDATKRLTKYAADANLVVALKATLSLADLTNANSSAGAKPAIAALQALIKKEAELNQLAPYIGPVLLSKLAFLRFAKARGILYSLLGETDEGARLSAAVGLAKIGDDGGKQVLSEVAGNNASPNQLTAAIALIEIGDYSGFDLLKQRLGDKDPMVKRTAALALGKIGEKESLQQLEPLLRESNKVISISAASALLTIVAAEPVVMAQAAVDWTQNALASSDWNVRASGAGVIGDLAPAKALPLLAQAITDSETPVRKAAAKSAGKIKTTEAAKQVMAAVVIEKDASTKEEMVKSLGRIADPVAKDTLVQLATDNGRIGMFASGSLIAVGDTGAVAKLETGIKTGSSQVRLAVVEASVVAQNKVVIPVLEIGVKDRNFDVSFASAEALADYTKSDPAIAMLQLGLKKSSLDFQARSVAALQKMSVTVDASQVDPAQLMDSPVVATRLTAVTLLGSFSWANARSLLSRAAVDPSPVVRRGTAEVLPTWADTNRADVVRALKVLIRDVDGGVRTVAQANLAKIGPSAFVAVATTAPVAPVAPTPVAPPDAAGSADLTALNAAGTKVDEQAAMIAAAGEEVTANETAITKILNKSQNDDGDAKEVAALSKTLEANLAAQQAALLSLNQAVAEATTAAGTTPTPDASQALAKVTASQRSATAAAQASATRYTALKPKIAAFSKAETEAPDMLLAAANSALATGRLSDAKRDLDKAAAAYKKEGQRNPSLDWSYGQLWDKQAAREKDDTKRIALLRRAKAAFDTFAASGSGKRAEQAKARSAEISEEIAGGAQ